LSTPPLLNQKAKVNMQQADISSFISALLPVVQNACRAIMSYHAQPLEVVKKPDNSPLTQADVASHRILVQGLERLAPSIPVVSEEDEEQKPGTHQYWLIDPLDGTRAFIRGGEDFSINIGLVSEGRPIFGMIAMPASGVVYVGGRDIGALKIVEGVHVPIAARATSAGGLMVVKSASHPSAHMQQFLDGLPQIAEIKGISSAVKFCLIAEGQADLYPRFGRTMEWDTAAGQAILEAAGGSMTTEDGRAFLYGKPNFENGPFIARGRSHP
jgi:3'(2'), 5'-bisphosphate nucleotidase